jgi:hypothetical protein
MILADTASTQILAWKYVLRLAQTPAYPLGYAKLVPYRSLHPFRASIPGLCSTLNWAAGVGVPTAVG